MQFAVDNLARREVNVLDVRRAAQKRRYSCPACGAPVHYRSADRQRGPSFVHNKNTASLDCENYYPGTGIWSPIPTPPRKTEAEDLPQEVGMCLDDADRWVLYLRLPELRELGQLRLRDLRTAFVDVDHGSDKTKISLMDLRVGLGSARVVIPPMQTGYRLRAGGVWPASISKSPWNSETRGLNPRGTLFVQRRGEWVRLKENSAIELGSELRFVALQSNPPPGECSPKGLRVVSHNRLDWKLWQLVLPTESSRALDRWTESVGVAPIAAAWKVVVMSVPLEFNSETPVQATHETIVARLAAPKARAHTMLSVQNGSGVQTISLKSSASPQLYTAFELPWPGTNELFTDNDGGTGTQFETERSPTLPALRESLRASPVLKVKIGETTASSWKEPFELVPTETTDEAPKVCIQPELEDLRLDLTWKGPEGRGFEKALSTEATILRIRSFWDKEVDVRVSAGALGTVLLLFRPANRTSRHHSVSRVFRWARLAEARERKHQEMKSRLTPRVLGAEGRAVTQGGRRSRWSPLVLSKMRELQNP